MDDRVKFTLSEDDIPYTWLNIAPDLGGVPPILDPATGEVVSRAELCRSIAEPLVEQELSEEPEFEIPGPVRDIYRQWRPTPLYRARRLERALDTPARIYYKYEGVSPTGSLKPNSAVPQAYYNKQVGKTGLITETGAGQWGSAIASAAVMFGLTAKIFMVGVSYRQKPYRRALMEAYGAVCASSPSLETEAGRAVLAEDPDHPGSLGIAKAEALEVAFSHPELGYNRGSSLNHVCTHQTVIGQEAILQMELADDYPDIVVAPCGGGSTLAGLEFPVPAEQAARRPGHTAHRRRTGRLPDSDPRADRLRLLRFFRAHPAVSDVHPGTQVRAAASARRWAAGARRLTPAHPGLRGRTDGGGRVAAERLLRGGPAVRPRGGHPPRPGIGPRGPGGRRRGASVPSRGSHADDSHRAVRAWEL